MKTSKDPKKWYDREYKMDAARVVVDGGRTIGEIASNTAVCYATIRAWVASYRKSLADSFPGSDKLSPLESQIKLDNEEIRKLKMQVGFLKKTMAYFVELPQ